MSSPVEGQRLAAGDRAEGEAAPAPDLFGAPEVHTQVTAEELAHTFEEAGPRSGCPITLSRIGSPSRSSGRWRSPFSCNSSPAT